MLSADSIKAAKVERVVISFDTNDGRYLKSMPLHHSQEVVDETPDRMTFELEVYITPDFIMELLSRAWSLKVHEPESLKQEICRIYSMGLKLNV